jgi:hypothetical protein
MWELRSLTALWTSTACYRNSFTFYYFMHEDVWVIDLLELNFSCLRGGVSRDRHTRNVFACGILVSQHTVYPTMLMMNRLWQCFKRNSPFCNMALILKSFDTCDLFKRFTIAIQTSNVFRNSYRSDVGWNGQLPGPSSKILIHSAVRYMLTAATEHVRNVVIN